MNTGNISRAYLVTNVYLLGVLNNESNCFESSEDSKRMACDCMLYTFCLRSCLKTFLEQIREYISEEINRFA